MGIVDFSLRRKVTVSMAAVAVVLFGVVAFTRLPINLLPDISYPSVTIETKLPGAAPAEIEVLISRPLEEAVGVVAGVQRMTSVSRPGLSQVTLEFDWGRQMDFAALDVRQKLDMVGLPREATEPLLMRFDPSNDPVMRAYLTGGDDLYKLRYVAEELVKKDLESTDGLAAIKVNGGYEEEIEVRVDEGKLALLGVSIDAVNDRLARENVNQAGGSLYEREARYLVRSRNEFADLDDIRDTVLLTRDGRNVTIGDVAEVVRGHKQREVITRFDGKEAVELALYKEGDSNTVTVARSLRTRLDNIAEDLPDGIEISIGLDQSSFIQASINEVLKNAGLGGVIAMMVLLFFLKDLKSTLIISVSIPISVVATFFMMYQTGTSLNVMSLGGLALGVGMLVDNAIVVLESIHKYREKGLSIYESARKGASEVGRAVIASTLTTIAVFLPVIFLEGIAAQLFLDQALTVSFSLIASLAVALTLIPMMASLAATMEEAAAAPAQGNRFIRVLRFVFLTMPIFVVKLVRWLFAFLLKIVTMLVKPLSMIFDRGLNAVSEAYPVLLGSALRSRGMVLTVAIALLVASISMIPKLGLDLMPAFSQGEFSFKIELPEGTPLEVTDRFVVEAQSILAEDERVESFSSIAGGRGLSLTSTGSEGENVGRIQVKMAPTSTPEDEEGVIVSLREQLTTSELARYKFERPSVFTFRPPVEIEVYGDNLKDLHSASEGLRKRAEQVPGLVDVKSTASLGNPELQITFNREQLSRLDLTLSQVAATIRNKVQGDTATRFTEQDREIDIVVRSVEVGRASVSDVQDMIVGQREGVPIFLKSVAEVKLAKGPSEVRRIGQKRVALVSGNLTGRDMGAVAEDLRLAIRREPLPATVTAVLGGQQEELDRSMRSLMGAMGLAIFLVYLVMASQFESFLHPFVIIFTLPLGAIGVIWALFLTGNTINVVAMIGAVMLAGIVVNNAIVLIDAVNQLREEGLDRYNALIEAGKKRLRPILMTSATTILGLGPMALGLGEGAELRAPLAITVIGGLAVATFMTLFIIPIVYSLVDRKEYRAGVEAEARVEDGTEGGLEEETAYESVPVPVEG